MARGHSSGATSECEGFTGMQGSENCTQTQRLLFTLHTLMKIILGISDVVKGTSCIPLNREFP